MGHTSSKRTEGFDPLRPDPPPLGGHEADLCLQIAERIDGYQLRISDSKANKLARDSSVYQAETNKVTLEIPPADPGKGPWWSGQVLWMNPSADNGLPHTRPPAYICLPSNLPKDSLAKTLLHERVHIHQRRYPEKWNEFFEKKWNFKPWSGRLPPELEKARRLNPDLLPIPFYVWKDTWVPYGSFNDPANPTLKQATTVFFNVKQKVVSKQPPDGWKAFFGSMTSDEHPWEIAAYLVVDPNKSPASKALEEAVKSLPNSFLNGK